jgi:hypothetical protein
MFVDKMTVDKYSREMTVEKMFVEKNDCGQDVCI